LPGVGAFGEPWRAGTATCARRSGVTPQREPLLGICLECSSSWTQRRSARSGGLGLCGHGQAVQTSLKVPHMGEHRESSASGASVRDLPDDSYFYFVIPITSRPTTVDGRLTSYPDRSSVIWRANVVATQFHPKKASNGPSHVTQLLPDVTIAKAPREPLTARDATPKRARRLGQHDQNDDPITRRMTGQDGPSPDPDLCAAQERSRRRAGPPKSIGGRGERHPKPKPPCLVARVPARRATGPGSIAWACPEPVQRFSSARLGGRPSRFSAWPTPMARAGANPFFWRSTAPAR